MSRLQDALARARGSENARDTASRAFFALFSWIWVLQLLIPWWETWRQTQSIPTRIITTAIALVMIGAYTYTIYRLNFRRRSWTEIFTTRESWTLRGVMIGSSLVLVFWHGGIWATSVVFVAIAIVLTAPPLQATRTALGTIVFVTVVLILARIDAPIMYTSLAFTALFSWLIAWQMRQGGMIGELIEARYTERRMAATEERLRIARDLHDTLGHTLSLLTLKSELASRLIDADPERAHREMQDVEQLARSAISDVRRTVSDDRKPILSSEIADARQLLDAAGIELMVDGDPATFPEEVATLFAWGVREGVTNVVRHSRARRCVIRFWHDGGTAHLSVTDDGGGSGSPGSGTGLASLRDRAGELDGSLSFDVLPDGAGHRLRLTVPMVSVE